MDKFQSTLPRGSDDKEKDEYHHPKNFNPRSLAGATAALAAPNKPRTISIHAPSWER